ncbi:MAG: C-terminal binding protein [Chloroflexi bacterium]|nr:C-terminal binding protein [Chloroflexota bacterium]
MASRVLVTDRVGPTVEVERAVLGELGVELIEAPDGAEPTLASLARGCVGIITNWAKTTRVVIDAARPELRVISRTGVGVDNIDVAHATACGIPVTNVPSYCEADVAEQAMALLLALTRKIAFADRSVRQGRWERESGPSMWRLTGKIIGLVGLGKIAREVIPRARGFGLEVIAYTPSLLKTATAERAAALGVRPVDLDTLFRTADVISLHCPLTDQTRALIDARTLAMMKSTAILINTSRGGLVDEVALYEALTTRQIAGAGLDVRVAEPPAVGDRLAQLDNVVSTPHAGYYSAVADLQALTAREVRRVLTGQAPLSVVNPNYRKVDKWPLSG